MADLSCNICEGCDHPDRSSQLVLKVETYLRMLGIKFETRSLGIAFAETAPT